MKKIYTLMATCFVWIGLFSQVEDLGDPGSSIPVDGGIVTITLMAAAYGAKRYKKNKDNKSL